MSTFTEQIRSRKGTIPCLFYPMARKMEISLTQLLTDSQKQAELLIETSRIPSIHAVIRMTELWCEAASFGMAYEISEKDFPRLGTPICTELDELANIEIPQTESRVTSPLLDAVRRSVPNMEKPLIVGATGPYTLCSVLNGSENFMMNCMVDPDAVHDILSRVTGYLIESITAYKSMGAAGVILAEPSASMVSPVMMDEFSNSYVQRIIKAVQDESFTVIYHNCGSVNKHLDTISHLNADAFHFGNQVDLDAALRLIVTDKFVMGNLDPRLFLTASPSEIENRTGKLMNAYAGYSNWIPSTGCDLSPSASMENVESFIRASTL